MTISRSEIEIVKGVSPADGRNTFIGASEVGCLFDAHPFMTRGDKFDSVCLDRRARAPTTAMQAGHMAERIVFDLLDKREVEGLEGLDVVHYTGVRWQDRAAHLAAMPDGFGVLDGGEPVLVECKFTSSPVNLHPDYGRLYWWWQVQAQMMLCPSDREVRRAVIVLLTGDLRLLHWWVEKDGAACRAIRHEAAKFWREVDEGRLEYRGRHPAYYETRDDIEICEGETARALDELCELYETARGREHEAKCERERRRNAILEALGARGEFHTGRYKMRVSGPEGRTPTIRITERL